MKQFLYFLFFAAVLAAGCKRNDQDNVAPPLSVKSFLPNSGNPGTVVTIHGTGFSRTLDANAVTFNGTKATVLNANDTTLVVASPDKGATGAIAVTVNGHSAQGGTYTYQALSLHGMTPANGPAGTSVTISGAGFTSLDSPAVVTVNGVRAIVSSANDTTLIITIPVTTGAGPIHVSVNGQEADGPVFAFNAITAIKPASGNTGTQVMFTGSGFSTTASDNIIMFNGVVAKVLSATATTLTVVAPANVQTGPVSVTINGQKTAGPVFTAVPAPVITTVAPLSGPVGAIVTLTGNYYSTLTDEDVITLNGTAVKILSATAKQLTFAVPAGATNGPIVLNVNGQTVTGPNYTVQSLGISSMLPDNGLDGTVVTIKGTGFDANAANDNLTINGLSIPVTAATDTTLTVTMPTGFTSGQMKLVVGSLTALSPKFRKAGVVTFYTGDAVMNNADGLVVDSKGYVYVSGNNQINKIAPDGSSYVVWAGSATENGNVDAQGNDARFFNISGMTIDANDNIYVTDGANASIRKVTPDAKVTTLGKNPNFTPKYLTTDPQGNIYFGSDYSGVGRLTPDGGVSVLFTNISPNGPFVYHNGFFYIGSGNGFIARLTLNVPGYTVFAGQNFNGGFADGPLGINRLNAPQSIVYDPVSNQLYFVDGYNYAIRSASIDDGTVTTITGAAGTFNQGQSGYQDGTLGQALFNVGNNSPIAVDKNGNIYVIDGGFNARIRKILLQ